MTTPTTFAAYRLATLDPIFSGSSGQAWASGIGSAYDTELAKWLTAARSLEPSRAVGDALDANGEWMSMPRISGETDAAYQTRQANVWATYGASGTATGIKQALELIGFPADGITISSTKSIKGSTWDWSYYVCIGTDLGSVFDEEIFATSVLGTCYLGSNDSLGMQAVAGIIPLVKRTAWRWKDVYSTITAVRWSFSSGYVDTPITYPLGQTFRLGQSPSGILDGVNFGDLGT